MLGNDLIGALFRGLRERDLMVEPRRRHKAFFPVLKLSGRAVHHVAHAVNKADGELSVFVHAYGDGVLRNELWLGCHDGLSGAALRQLILCALAHVGVVYLRDDQLFHKSLYKCGFAGPDRPNYAEHESPVRPCRNIAVNISVSHNKSLRSHVLVCTSL